MPRRERCATGPAARERARGTAWPLVSPTSSPSAGGSHTVLPAVGAHVNPSPVGPYSVLVHVGPLPGATHATHATHATAHRQRFRGIGLAGRPLDGSGSRLRGATARLTGRSRRGDRAKEIAADRGGSRRSRRMPPSTGPRPPPRPRRARVPPPLVPPPVPTGRPPSHPAAVPPRGRRCRASPAASPPPPLAISQRPFPARSLAAMARTARAAVARLRNSPSSAAPCAAAARRPGRPALSCARALHCLHECRRSPPPAFWASHMGPASGRSSGSLAAPSSPRTPPNTLRALRPTPHAVRRPPAGAREGAEEEPADPLHPARGPRAP